MKHVSTFEQFNTVDTEQVNEEIKILGKDIKIFKSFDEQRKSRLSFLEDIDLDSLKPGANQREIKDIMLRVDKATKLKEDSFRNVIEEAQVMCVVTMLEALKDLKSDLVREDKSLGFIFYMPERKEFIYHGSSTIK
jgi:hypothetical protein